jgi:type II secretory pathway pseudopilin PulG
LKEFAGNLELRMKRKTNSQKGFTLLEAVAVIGIMFTLMAIAVVQSFGSMESYNVNSAQDVVVSQLRVARGVAIANRRDVQVFFNPNPGAGLAPYIAYQVLPAPGSNEQLGPLMSQVLPPGTQYMLENGVPDTPMAFGNGAAIYIGNTSGGPATMEFTSVGQFTDGTGFNTLNGTVFLGVPGQPNSARAVTIMGGTGRVRPYTYIGNATWEE